MSLDNAPSDDVRMILQIERETMAAILSKDIDALSRILADEFVYRTPGNPDTGKADFLRGITSIPVEVIAIWGDELSVYVSGETAALTGVQHTKYRTGAGAEGINSVAFTDVLIKRDGQWLMALAHGVELPPSPEGQPTDSV